MAGEYVSDMIYFLSGGTLILSQLIDESNNFLNMGSGWSRLQMKVSCT